MMRALRVLSAIFGVVGAFTLAAGPATAQTYGKAPIPGDVGPDAPKYVGIDNVLAGAVPLDLTFTDHDGRLAPLREYIGGKPTLLVLHYNRCPKLCNEVIKSLLTALNDARKEDVSFVAGGPFNVVLVSIDPREAFTIVRKNRELFLREYDGRNPDVPGVWFLTASHGQGTDLVDADKKIHHLAAAVGFRYQMRFRNQDFVYNADDAVWRTSDGKANLPAEPRNYDYGHASGFTVLTPDGTVSKQILGLNFVARDIRLSLVEASGGKIGTWADAVSQYCFTYDSVKGHYRITMTYLGWIAAPFVLLVVFLAGRTVRSAMAEPILAPGEAPTTPTTA
ncbi:MAG: hypothetical protein ACRC7O_02880 [Fimbriiglobus sp.]